MTINPIYYSEDVKKIIQIEFSIFRNKDVESYSVVSNEPFGINLPESYEVKNRNSEIHPIYY